MLLFFVTLGTLVAISIQHNNCRFLNTALDENMKISLIYPNFCVWLFRPLLNYANKFPVVRNVTRIWFSLAYLLCNRSESGEILTRLNFDLRGWINFDMLLICHHVNEALFELDNRAFD